MQRYHTVHVITINTGLWEVFSKNITLYNSNMLLFFQTHCFSFNSLDHILNILQLMFTHLHTPISLSVIIFPTCSLSSISHWPTHLFTKQKSSLYLSSESVADAKCCFYLICINCLCTALSFSFLWLKESHSQHCCQPMI